MKKFLYALLATLALASCSGQKFALIYNVDIDGRANGNILVEFPDGRLNLDGASNLAFHYGNDTTIVADQRIKGDQLCLTAASLADEFIDNAFKATALSGTYYLHIYGIVKESLTGLEVKIDKILTNE